MITDQYWFEIINSENLQNPLPALRQTVADIIPVFKNNDFFAGKKRIRAYVIDVMGNQADYKLMSDAAASISGGIIFLSPLLSADACRLAGDFPDKQIAVFGFQPEADCGAENYRIFSIDHSSAYFEAGSWAAREGTEVFPLFYTGTERAAEMMEAFKDGWKKVSDEKLPEMKEILRPDETQVIDSYIKSVENSPGCIAAVLAGPLTVTVLDRLDGLSVRILTEKVRLWSESGYSVSASIELSPVKMLSEAVTYAGTESYGTKPVIKAEFILYEN